MPGVTVDPAALIVAFSGLLTAVWGVKQSKKGQAVEERQRVAANDLAERAQNHDIYRDMVTDLQTQIEHKNAELCRKDAEVTRQLELRRHEHEACSETTHHLQGLVKTLQHVVLDEVARESAEIGLLEAARHIDAHPVEDL